MSNAIGSAPLEVLDLQCTYGDVPALHAVNLDIGSGEFISLLGPSGCGKTTLLRCIAGLIDPSAGDIRLAGRSIAAVPIHKRNLGMVFQSYALFPHMSVAENVAFGLQMARVPKAEIGARVTEALALVAMEHLRDRNPTQLSGGQQQRVALARSIVTRPAVLLLDEPFGALDAQLRTTLQSELRSLQKNLHVTTVFVTHDQEEAMIMSDRIAVMNGGRIHQFADPMTIYNRPATTFVAQFVGQVNRFDRSTDTIQVAAGGCAMIRPERIFMGEGPAEAGVRNLSGIVRDSVFCGNAIRITAGTALGDVTLAQKNTAATPLPAEGEAIQLWWRDQDVMRFAADGQAVPA